MLNTKEFGALIAARRREIGMTQEAFAAMLGITPQAISKWENGVGYPDVTLFPHIASALGISLDTLFGTQNETEHAAAIQAKDTLPAQVIHLTIPGAPTMFCSLSPVAQGSQYLCYSDKALSSQQDDRVEFADGSVADLKDGEVVNRGTGEIRLLPVDILRTAEEPKGDLQPIKRQSGLPYFHSLCITVRGAGEVCVKSATDKEGSLEINGIPTFVASVAHRIEGETLHLDIQPQAENKNGNAGGKVTVCLPDATGGQLSLHITGACEARIEPPFSHVDLSVNGCGDIKGGRAKTLISAINGCGDIRWEAAEENASITVNGSGNITMEHTANPHINIGGCGDLTLRQVLGSMSLTVGGSGSVFASGELEQLSCHMGGCGNLRGEQLSVGEASIIIQNESTVRLGRIRSHSVEKIGSKAALTVDHRGNPVGGTAKLPLK